MQVIGKLWIHLVFRANQRLESLKLNKNAIVVNSRMETNIPGIYAAGDICTYDGKVKLIASGFGEAPTAISNAKVYIDPASKVQPLHSTSLMEERKKKLF